MELGAGSPSTGAPDVSASWGKVAVSATRLKVACQGRAPWGLCGLQGAQACVSCSCLFILGAVAKSGCLPAEGCLSAVFVYLAECREGQGERQVQTLNN